MSSRSESKIGLAAYFLAALVAFLIVGGLAWFLWYRTRPAPLNQARIEERLKNLQEINDTAAEALNHFGWQDQSKGLVRLPVTNAMEMIVREWKIRPPGGLISWRGWKKANPPPPPKAPEKPNQFE